LFRPAGHVVPIDDGKDVPGWEDSTREMHRELQVQFADRESEIVQATKSFLPRILQDSVGGSTAVVMHRCTGCVVFSDASGFTKLTETLAQRADGAEVLSKSLNKFFTPLIDIIEAYRGDVIKFSGDALSILFEATDDYELHPCPCGSPESERKTPQQLACLRASACCLEIHKRLHNFDTGVRGVVLTLHIGVGAGSIAVLQVGGEHGRYEYVIAGTPMEQIAIAEPLASSGEAVLSPQTWNEVSYTAVEGDPLTEGPSGYHRLVAFDTHQHTYPTVKQAAVECSRAEAERLEALEDRILLKQSERFIPRAVLKHLRSGNSSSVNEMRSVTIIFVQIGGVDVSTETGSQVAQELMVNMQRACYNLEGNLNKFLVDDKGLLFLFVYGMPPVVHIDDPSRAIMACFDMIAA
jgi:class 3 adenylate cyclase